MFQDIFRSKIREIRFEIKRVKLSRTDIFWLVLSGIFVVAFLVAMTNFFQNLQELVQSSSK